jgi:hypothetical protein
MSLPPGADDRVTLVREALSMTASVTRGRCPGCQSVLRIPTEWVSQTVRCKRCGAMLQASPKVKVPPPAAPPPTPAAVAPPTNVAGGTANGTGLAPGTPDPFSTITPPAGTNWPSTY